MCAWGHASLSGNQLVPEFLHPALVGGVPKLDQSFFYAAFTVMSGATWHATVSMFGQALQDYRAMRPPDMDVFNYRHINQMLNCTGKDYMTACTDNVVLNISARVGKAFKLFFDALPQEFRAEDRNRLVSTETRVTPRTHVSISLVSSLLELKRFNVSLTALFWMVFFPLARAATSGLDARCLAVVSSSSSSSIMYCEYLYLQYVLLVYVRVKRHPNSTCVHVRLHQNYGTQIELKKRKQKVASAQIFAKAKFLWSPLCFIFMRRTVPRRNQTRPC